MVLELSAYLHIRYSNLRLENYLVRKASRLRKKMEHQSTERIVIFGASFNPTTLSHIDFMRCLLQANPPFAKVCLIPSGQSPLKTAEEYASVTHRLQILDLALYCQLTALERGRITVDTTEAGRRSPSWMVMTLTGLILSHRAQAAYVLACGYDHLYQLQKWYRWQDFATLCELHFYPRTEINILNMTAVDACIALCQAKIKITVLFLEARHKETFYALCLQRLREQEVSSLMLYLNLVWDPHATIRAGSASDIRAFYQSLSGVSTEAPEGICPEVHHYIMSHHCYQPKLFA